MPVVASAPVATSSVAQDVEQRILSCTGGRICRLAVEVRGERLFIQGCTASYYVKHLVIQAVADALGQPSSLPVELDVQVLPERPRPPEGSQFGSRP
jgi:hypothetical protein